MSQPLTDTSSLDHFFNAFLRYSDLLEQRCAHLEHRLGEQSSHGAYAASSTMSSDVPPMLTSAAAVDLYPITPLLEDRGIDDIMINGPSDIYIERAGNVERSDISFQGPEELVRFVENILAFSGMKIDPMRPLIDTRLPDGSRVNIVMPPLAIDGINISIRKIGHADFSLQSLVDNGTLNKQIADFLRVCASIKLNIVVSGGTGSGKTTMLNAIANHIRSTDRIVTIENPAELRLDLPNIVRLEWVDINQSGNNAITTRELVRNALRMRPDRIIVGEVRGPEAFDMLQAMNTGHEGSLTTIHANTPRDGLARIENMIGMADLNLPITAIRRQIASAIHLVIQIMRMEDGSRRLVKLSEIVGMESDTVVMQDIFIFKQSGVDEKGIIQGQHIWTGIFPKHQELNRALREAGMMTIVAGTR